MLARTLLKRTAYRSGPALSAFTHMGLDRNKRQMSVLAPVAGGVGTVVSVGALIMFERYQVANSNQYVVLTGLGIDDIWIGKKGFQWPFQKYAFIDMTPLNYTFDLRAMSREMLEFDLPVSIAIGVKDDPESLIRYSRFLLREDHDVDILNDLIRGIIEGETRVLTAATGIQDLFDNRGKIKAMITDKIQKELDSLGLEIINANIKEMKDPPGSVGGYFESMRQKATSEAQQKALVDIAEAKKKSDIGEKERRVATRKELANLEAQAVETENRNKRLIAQHNAKLAVVEQESNRVSEVATIEAKQKAKMRDVELQREVEELRITQETAQLQADQLTKARVEASSAVATADGEREATQLRADAELYKQQKLAEGVLANYQAKADGLQRIYESLGGSPELMRLHIGTVDTDYFQTVAEEQARAVQNMKPNVNIWTTGGDKGGNVGDTLTDMMRKFVPMVDILQQKGINMDWMMKKGDKSPLDPLPASTATRMDTTFNDKA